MIRVCKQEEQNESDNSDEIVQNMEKIDYFHYSIGKIQKCKDNWLI